MTNDMALKHKMCYSPNYIRIYIITRIIPLVTVILYICLEAMVLYIIYKLNSRIKFLCIHFSRIIKIQFLFGFIINQRTQLFGMISSKIIKTNHRPLKTVAYFAGVCTYALSKIEIGLKIKFCTYINL